MANGGFPPFLFDRRRGREGLGQMQRFRVSLWLLLVRPWVGQDRGSIGGRKPRNLSQWTFATEQAELQGERYHYEGSDMRWRRARGWVVTGGWYCV